MNRIFNIVFLLTFSLPSMVMGQDVIGMHSDSIHTIMSENYPEFSLNTTNVNNSYKYLKYEDYLGTQTILMFLSDSNTCRYVKKMCSYNFLDKVVNQLDRDYLRVNDTLWMFNVGDMQMTKHLEKQDWFFTVVTKRTNR